MRKNHSFNDSNWKRMALCCSKKLSALLTGITSKDDTNFYCLNCLESYSKVCENKGFCGVAMPFEDTKNLDFNQYQKFD